jgi:PAS domain S-box-containing protein
VVWEVWGEPGDAAHRITFVSQHAEAMLGYSVGEWLAIPNFWLAIVHPDDRQRAARQAAAIFASGKGGSHQFRWVTKDGRILRVESQVAVVRDGAGRPIGRRGVTMDITARKRMEEALRASEERYRTIVEEQTELICRYLPHTTLTFVNEAYCRYFGKTRDELIGQSFLALIPEQARQAAREHVRSLCACPLIEIYEHPVFSANGEIRWQQSAGHDGVRPAGASSGYRERDPDHFITAHDDVSTYERARNTGAACYLRKPFDGQALIGAIGRAIGQGSSRTVAPEAFPDNGGDERR